MSLGYPSNIILYNSNIINTFKQYKITKFFPWQFRINKSKVKKNFFYQT